jgi:hypothetical protein
MLVAIPIPIELSRIIEDGHQIHITIACTRPNASEDRSSVGFSISTKKKAKQQQRLSAAKSPFFTPVICVYVAKYVFSGEYEFTFFLRSPTRGKKKENKKIKKN